MGYGSGGCTYGSDNNEPYYSSNDDVDDGNYFYDKCNEQSAEIIKLKNIINDLKSHISKLTKHPLTEEQIYDALCKKGMLGSQGQYTDPYFIDIARVIEQAHGIKEDKQ